MAEAFCGEVNPPARHAESNIVWQHTLPLLNVPQSAPMLKSFHRAAILRLALTCAVLAGFVLALALAALPELHERIHHTSDHQEHQCLATTIGGGGSVDAPSAPTLASFVAMLFAVVPVDGSRMVESLILGCSVLEHAPPVIS